MSYSGESFSTSSPLKRGPQDSSGFRVRIPALQQSCYLLTAAARWITPIFVAFDILSLIVQLIGAVAVSSTKATDENAANKLKIGKDVALIGLALQIVAFGLFTIVAARFHFTSQRFETKLQSRLEDADRGRSVFVKGSSRKINPQWRRLLYAINVSCVLILVSRQKVQIQEASSNILDRYDPCSVSSSLRKARLVP